MSRHIGKQGGYLRRQGPSWVLTYRTYHKDAETGEIVTERHTEAICPADLSKREATKEAEPIIAKANAAVARPSIRMSVEQFYDTRFNEAKLWKLKPAGRKHYAYLWQLIQPDLGGRRLCDVEAADVEAIIRKKYRAGYAAQTLRHIKNAISAIFRVAKKQKLYDGDNPAADIDLPETVAAKRTTLTPDQLAAVLPVLPAPVYQMAALSVQTSLGPAELCGLRMSHCNLTAEIMPMADGTILAPYAIAVRENWYEGERGSLKTGSRMRNVPITPELAAMLEQLPRCDQSPDAPLFQSRNGTPIDCHNVSNRLFKRVQKDTGIKVTWYAFRRAHSTMAAVTGADLADRKLMMGHSKDRMTQYYDVADVERMRSVSTRIQDRLAAAEKQQPALTTETPTEGPVM